MIFTYPYSRSGFGPLGKRAGNQRIGKAVWLPSSSLSQYRYLGIFMSLKIVRTLLGTLH